MRTTTAIWLPAVVIALVLAPTVPSIGEEAKVASGQQRTDVEPLALTDALESIQVRAGFQLELVAAEPLLNDPVAIDWDTQGRLWVVEMADYPLGMDGQGKPGGRVRILQDTDDDGRYDKSTLFLDGLSFPNGIITWRNGALITAAPDILYAEDTDDDGRADKIETLFTGFNPGNQQLRMNGLRWGLDNWIYCASGSHHAGYGAQTGVTATSTGQRVVIGSRDFRIRPDEHLIDPQSGPSQFGRNRDDWGNWFGVQNSYPLWHYVLEDHYIRRNPFYAPPNPRRDLTESNPTLYPIKTPQKRFHSFEHATRFTSACSGNIYRDNLLFGNSPPQDPRQHSFTCAPFHSLVQHNVIREDGTSFQLARDPVEQGSEFFASTDRWCRPVMVRTGPDGALWIVDMHRYMIEHPEWVNEVARNELRPYYRHGEDLGRIYRVFPAGDTAHGVRAIPRLADLSTEQLVTKLSDSNGWVRDKCQQLLIWRADKSAVERLKQLVTGSDVALARLHAICTLEGLDELDEPTLQAALRDEHGGVRRHAIRLAEGCQSTPVLESLLSLVPDNDAKVRLQLACSLGEFSDSRVGAALGKLLTDSRNDKYIQAAAMSSISNRNVRMVLSVALASDELNQDILRALVRIAAKTNEQQALAAAVESISHGRTTRWQFDALAALLDVVPLSEAPWVVENETIAQILAIADTTARDSHSDQTLRIAAIQLIGRESQLSQQTVSAARQLLSPQQSPPIQAAMVARLSDRSETAVAVELLKRWRNYSPMLRGQIVEVLLSRESWIGVLLEAIASQHVLTLDLDAATKQRLLTIKNPEWKTRAENLLAASATTDRQAVMAEYRAAWQLTEDVAAGKKVFEDKCASCHRFGETGKEIGPNLAALTDKSPESLFTSILDPNRAVEAKYLSYTVADNAGRMHSGLIKTETATSITLVTSEAKEVAILRSEIEELTSSGKSLMPDGLEKELSLQDLADLLGYMRGVDEHQ